MKRIIGIAIVALMFVSCTQAKIGYVDIEEIVKEYKGTKDAEKAMNEKSAGIKGQLDQLAADYQKKVTDYYAKAEKMSNKSRQEAEGALMQDQEALKQRQQQAQVAVQKDGQDRMIEINESIEDFVEDYAKANGYSFILGTSDQTRSVLYGDAKSDITDTILDELNDSYKKDKPADKEEKESN
jgi:outer membrane protein